MDSLSSNPSRKRARSPDADCEECMPISKRIHNLNIRSRGCSIDDDDNPLNNNAQLESNCCCSTNRCHPQPGTSASTDSVHWLSTAGGGPGTHHHHHHNNGHPTQPMNPHQQQTLPNAFPCLPPQHTNNPCQPNHPTAGVIPNMNGLNSLEPYEPELDATENPHYYHQNRLLYVAHIERVRRTKPD